MTIDGWRRPLGLALVAMMLVGGAAFAACDDDEDDGDNGEPVATVAAEDSPEAAETEPADEPTREPAESTLTVNVAEAGGLGTILTDADGLTLYTFANDTAGSGTSACVDACANAWPPLTVESGEPSGPDQLTGELATITRPDGTTQVTYNGLPLYRFVNDAAPGDTNGHELNDVWFAATP